MPQGVEHKIMRYTDVQAQLDTLIRLKNSIVMDIDNLRHGKNNSIPWSERCIRESSSILKKQKVDFDLVRSSASDCTGDNFRMQVNGKEFTDRVEVGAELLGLAHYFLDEKDQYNQWSQVGHYGGFELLLMAPGENIVKALLRGPSQKTYGVSFVRDRNKSADRIEAAFSRILDLEQQAQKSVAENQEKIKQIQQELVRKQQQLGDVRSQVQEFATEKSQLEVELGLSESADASMLALCGEEEE